MTTISDIYRGKVTDGSLRPDAGQEEAIGRFQALAEALAAKKRPKDLRGLYLWGGVGRGKSMLMDLFFDHVSLKKKRRVHFHAFMLEVHDFMHQRRSGRKASDRIDSDLIAFADHIAKDARLLCFDEFQVTDVADAMILGRLFTALFEKGVMVVATSNTAPDDLYRDGLQRDRFLPFIALLKEKQDIIHFDGAKDYRLDRLRGKDTYFWPADDDARKTIDGLFQKLTDGTELHNVTLSFKGRTLVIPRSGRGVARFTFDELCGKETSALDFIELARNYKTVILENIPKLGDDKRNETVRFITLIDTLYEHKAFLIASAAAMPDQLYHGRESAKTFPRTASRLMEMQGKEWLSSAGKTG